MRIVTLTIKDDILIPLDTLAGQTGEHHDTQLKVVLPSGWKGQDTYSLWFRNAGGVYQTEALTEPVSYLLPSGLLRPGKLEVWLEAKTGDAVHRTAKAELHVAPSPDWDGDSAPVPEEYDGLVAIPRAAFETAMTQVEQVYDAYNSGALTGKQGPAGPKGDKGDPGDSIEVVVLANKDAYDALPASSKQDAAKIYAWGY